MVLGIALSRTFAVTMRHGANKTLMETSNYYQLLNVSKEADVIEIKRAYRSLVQTLHPDHNAGSAKQEERFRAVQQAYEILSDPSRRLRYDRVLLDETGDMLWSLGNGQPVVAGRLISCPVVAHLTFHQALEGGGMLVDVAGVGEVRVPVPQGVRSGIQVRLRVEGATRSHGESDSLHIVFHVEPSPRFRREGDDLHIQEPITVIEALLGTQRSITNAYGQNVKVSIPSGTQPGERLRLRGQGVKTATQHGDLYVEVQIVVPRTLTQEQRQTLAACVRDLGLQ